MLVAAAVVVLSGLYVRSARAPEAGTATEAELLRATQKQAGAEIVPPAPSMAERPAGTIEAPPQLTQATSKPAREHCPAPVDTMPAAAPAAPHPDSVEPAVDADPSPKPAPSNKIEPYFGATP
jgi:hypothetical protein